MKPGIRLVWQNVEATGNTGISALARCLNFFDFIISELRSGNQCLKPWENFPLKI